MNLKNLLVGCSFSVCSFAIADPLPAESLVARFNSWRLNGPLVSPSVIVRLPASLGGGSFVGGSFLGYSEPLSDVDHEVWGSVRWKNGEFSAFANFLKIDGTEASLGSIKTAVLFQQAGSSSPILVVGGIFNRVNDVVCNGVASYDGSSWSAIGNLDGASIDVIRLFVAKHYFGGTPTLLASILGTVDQSVVAKYVPSTDTWFSFVAATGSGPTSYIRAITENFTGSTLFFGGDIFLPNNCGSVCAFNGSTDSLNQFSEVSGLDRGLDKGVSDLVWFPESEDGQLFAAGSFLNRCTVVDEAVVAVRCANMARFDGFSWIELGVSCIRKPNLDLDFDEGELFSSGASEGCQRSSLPCGWPGNTPPLRVMSHSISRYVYDLSGVYNPLAMDFGVNSVASVIVAGGSRSVVDYTDQCHVLIGGMFDRFATEDCDFDSLEVQCPALTAWGRLKPFFPADPRPVVDDVSPGYLSIRAAVEGSSRNLAFRWQVRYCGEEWTDLVDESGVVIGAATTELSFSYGSGSRGQVRLAATNDFATTSAPAFSAGVTFGPPSLADVASDSLDTAYDPNGSVGPEDLDAFIAGFIADNLVIADVASDSLDTVRNPNGSVGPEDLDAFIAAFGLGC